MSEQPIDALAAQIARLAGKTAFRILRGLNKHDSEDALQEALLKCWEDQKTFDPARGSLGAWFHTHLMSAVRDIRREHRRRASLEDAPEVAAPDDTVRAASIEQAQNRLLSRVDRRALELLADGCSAAEIADACGLNAKAVVALARRLKRAGAEVVEQEPPAAVSAPRGETDERAPARIDREIARLDFPPKTGAECCPSGCIRCRWFDGYKPPKRRVVAAEVVSAEVRAAQASVYARKVEISAAVRGKSVGKGAAAAAEEAA